MENSSVIVEFVKGFLKHRFEHFEHELFKKVREFMNRSPLMELIKDRHLLREFQYHTKKIIEMMAEDYGILESEVKLMTTMFIRV